LRWVVERGKKQKIKEIIFGNPGHQGLVAISVLMEIGELSNSELRKITNQLVNVQYGGKFEIPQKNDFFASNFFSVNHVYHI
jgi:hypothetical protein